MMAGNVENGTDGMAQTPIKSRPVRLPTVRSKGFAEFLAADLAS